MPTFEPEDFLAALQRLYTSQLKFDEELREMKEQQLKTDAHLASVGSYVRETAEIVRLVNEQMQHSDARLDQLVGVVRSHEERLQRIENRPS
jgi:hypothetical protein